ncbi:MAG: RecX family transcriptional regulator [Actinomycetota bacterium]|nr:RecX family transcriptional regulator [Actinomycetota bacterium]
MSEESLQDALRVAYAYLNRCERTVAETRLRIEREGVSAATSEAVLDELIGAGYLDDARYARLFVQDKRTLEAWGAARIRRALAGRGVDRDLVEAALAQEEGETELDRALALLARRFPEAPRERRERDRALGMLLRRGYDSELAVEALAAYARGLNVH